ncbi:MAG: hypothetical protein JNK45_01560 [Myxococcales bacterium]|nr:hypothetical protein [Myxococcales bacterium]
MNLRRCLLSCALLTVAACSGDDAPAVDTDATSAGASTSDTSSSTTASTGVADTSSTTDATGSTTGEGSSTGEGTGSTTGGDPVWTAPTCELVLGTGAVTFTFDEGATLTPMDQQIEPVTYTFGVAALGLPGAMLAGTGGRILASADAGCSWEDIGAANGEDTAAVILRAAGERRAYGFGDNRRLLVRVDGDDDGWTITTLDSPTDGDNGIVGLAVDPDAPDHVRLGDSLGQLWDSTDAGATWDALGLPAVDPGGLAYRAVFDPQDLEHALFGLMVEGVRVTTDAGGEWADATGFGAGNANGFNLAVSPAQPGLVWAEAYDLAEPDEAAARHIYRSEDGGASFTAVVDSDEATLYNGNPLFPHPTDPDVLYFVFGSNYAGYGTDVHRYDHATGEITITHNMWHDVAAIEFLPGDPGVMYFGLSIEP